MHSFPFSKLRSHSKSASRCIKLISVLFVLICSSSCTPEPSPHQESYRLIERILPGQSEHFVLEEIKTADKQDRFELSGEKGKIIIRGSNPLAIAKGFNYYLNNFCNTRVSWYVDDAVIAPEILPVPDTLITKDCRFERRFFLNYCTFGYTMLWWQWDDWERFIDWMALNGINMPLAITGQEAIWMKVWKEFGMGDEEIRAYFTGPAHLPWHRMGNLDGFLGPLPQEFIDHQFDLQKKILARERSLGMKPVLPAFAGHVPKAIKQKYPQAKITSMGSYGLGDDYEAFFLDPMDSLFIEIQEKFLHTQNKYFGNDHLYGADPFNEMDPPDTTPEYLALVSKTIYEGMSKVDPEAQWVQMGWTFYYMKLWRENPARLKAMIEAVPQNRMIILDYFAEKEEVWRNTSAWYGAPYVWCYLGNFGGNTEMAAPIIKVAKRLEEAEKDPTKGNLTGIGSTLEGFGVNRFMFEWLFDYAWNQDVTDVNAWIKQYAKCRTKNRDSIAEEAFQKLVHLVYQDQVSGVGTGSILQTRPALSGFHGYQRPSKYDYFELTNILEQMLNANSQSLQSTEYQKDLVLVCKQVLDNLLIPVRTEINEAYERKDTAALLENIRLFMEIMDDQDRLLATQTEFLLGKWIDDARAFGSDSAEKAYYEKDARVLISTWGNEGNNIVDYASRNLSGMITSYYKTRWQIFFDIVQKNVSENKTLDMDSINRQMEKFEWAWTDEQVDFNKQPQGSALKIAQEIHAKYSPVYKLFEK